MFLQCFERQSNIRNYSALTCVKEDFNLENRKNYIINYQKNFQEQTDTLLFQHRPVLISSLWTRGDEHN